MFRMSARSPACVVWFGWMSKHTKRAFGFRCRNSDHSAINAVPRPRPASTHDSLSETKMMRSAFALRLFSRWTGALQFVPPPPIEASRPAFVITLSREFRSTGTTACSNGSTIADGFFRLLQAGDRAGLEAAGFPQGRAQYLERTGFRLADDTDDLGRADVQRRHQTGAIGGDFVVHAQADRLVHVSLPLSTSFFSPPLSKKK